MYLVFTASKDTYITNKIISTTARATDANVGAATTIDLFKLYDETTLAGTTNAIELSRALIKFNLAAISSSLEGKVDFADSSFSAKLKLHDVQGNQVAPADFNLMLMPLSQSFDEGSGKDISTLTFLDRTNYVTASFSDNTDTLWNTAGAFASGTLNASDIDVIEDASIGGSSTYLVQSQHFDIGNENLELDVTTIVSASMTGILPDHGFLIAYSGSEEHDERSRFVKRFASRHTRNPYIRPKLVIQYDDSIRAHNTNFEFNVTGSLFLENRSRGSLTNILSGSANTIVSGSNCLLVKLHTGSYEKYFTGSSAINSGIQQDGIYSASLAIDRYLSSSVTSTETLEDFIVASGSVTFGQEWLSLDENISYFTGSLKIEMQNRSVGNTANKYKFAMTNLNQEYKFTDRPRLEVFITDVAAERTSVRIPVRLSTVMLDKVYYQIRDAYNGKILTPFVRTNDVTRLSSDSETMYFKPSLDHLPAGRTYTIDFMTVIDGIVNKYTDNGAFRITR